MQGVVPDQTNQRTARIHGGATDQQVAVEGWRVPTTEPSDCEALVVAPAILCDRLRFGAPGRSHRCEFQTFDREHDGPKRAHLMVAGRIGLDSTQRRAQAAVSPRRGAAPAPAPSEKTREPTSPSGSSTRPVGRRPRVVGYELPVHRAAISIARTMAARRELDDQRLCEDSIAGALQLLMGARGAHHRPKGWWRCWPGARPPAPLPMRC